MPKAFLIRRKSLLKFLTEKNFEKGTTRRDYYIDTLLPSKSEDLATLEMPLKYSSCRASEDEELFRTSSNYHSYCFDTFKKVDKITPITETSKNIDYFNLFPRFSDTYSEDGQSYNTSRLNCNNEQEECAKDSKTEEYSTTVVERPFVCTICGKSFRLSSTLCRHKIIHTSQRPHKCEVCNKSFNRSSTLKTHLRTHSKTKEFRCNVCDKGFHQKGNLRNHVLIHTGEKPYTCHYCAKAFNKLSNLKFHMHTHTDQQPYRCRFCKLSMSRRGELKQHIISMHHEERMKELQE